MFNNCGKIEDKGELDRKKTWAKVMLTLFDNFNDEAHNPRGSLDSLKRDRSRSECFKSKQTGQWAKQSP